MKSLLVWIVLCAWLLTVASAVGAEFTSEGKATRVRFMGRQNGCVERDVDGPRGTFQWRTDCSKVIAEMDIVSDRWVIRIRKGYGLLDLFILLDDLPNFPLAETLVNSVERRLRNYPRTSKPPIVEVLE